MAFPANCGKRFAYLLTSGDGKVSYSSPCGDGFLGVCSGADRERAKQRADEAFGLVRQAWNAVMAEENKRQAWPITQLHRDAVEAYEARYEALPTHLITLQLAAHIDKIWASVAEATCLIDVLDAAATEYGAGGVPTPDVPKPPPKPPSPLNTLALVGGLGAVFVLAVVVLK